MLASKIRALSSSTMPIASTLSRHSMKAYASVSTSIASFSSSSSSSSSAAAANLPKACVVGAAGGIGQPLSMLLKLSPHIGSLSVYDLVGSMGVAADLDHVNTPGVVEGFEGAERMRDALKGCDVVVIPAGVPRKPGMTRDDLFKTNASINKSIAEACADACPNANLLIISNPVNSNVPIFRETLKKKGTYNPRRLFGVSTLDVVRANTFVARKLGTSPTEQNVKVVGGHSGTTIIPLLSQVAGANFSKEDLDELTYRIQFGGDEVVKAKDGRGSATLSMAYAGAHFTERLMRAVAGEKGVVECAYVESPVAQKDGLEFFASPVALGPEGIHEIHEIGKMSDMEQANYNEMVPALKKQQEAGYDFVKNN